MTAVRGERFDGCGVEVKADNFELFRDQLLRHGSAHCAETDKPDRVHFRVLGLNLIVGVEAWLSFLGWTLAHLLEAGSQRLGVSSGMSCVD